MEKPLNYAMLVEEATKVVRFAMADSTKKHSLVFVPLDVDSKLVKSLKSDQISESALYFPNGSVITDGQENLLLPANMDIIILTDKGVKSLITEYNWALLKKGSMDIEEYLRGLPQAV